MKISTAVAILLFVTHGLLAQTKPSQQHATSASSAADRMGLTCPQILQIGSTDSVARFKKEKDASPQCTARAVAAYGKCYDARTDTLAAALAKKAGPSKTARTDFLSFENALREFVSKAVSDAQSA